MKLTSIRPTLNTKDLPGTIQWYQDVLGFQCLAHEESWGWACLRRDQVDIMLALPNAHLPFDQPAFTGSLYFGTEDVDGWWAILKYRATVCYPIENFDYGMREFAVYDPNGYLLQFGQELPAPAR